jgi:hypothetical protein
MNTCERKPKKPVTAGFLRFSLVFSGFLRQGGDQASDYPNRTGRNLSHENLTYEKKN